MKNGRVIKNALSLCLIGILLNVVMMPVVNTHNVRISSNGNILYVGGSGMNNYTKIQDAINNATDGDTIFVYDDSSPYYENIVIYKSINLIGENKNTTVIDGSKRGDVVNIIANKVNVSGFEIKNSGIEWGDIGIEINSDCVVVFGNIITNNGYGIGLFHSSNNTISQCNISDNRWIGVSLEDSFNNYISENIISSNNAEGWAIIVSGIGLDHSSGNVICGNTVSDNKWKGIWLKESSDNIISGNIIVDNDEIGIYIFESSGNTISGNSILDHTESGITIDNSWFNVIKNNNFVSNRIHAFLAFDDYPWYVFSNLWIRNYWGNWAGLIPKPIFGFFLLLFPIVIFFPLVNFDLCPRLFPYK